jgi:hypothetical protein
MLSVAVAVLAVAIAAKLAFDKRSEYKKLPGTKSLSELPSPPALPVFGHVIQLMRHGVTQASCLPRFDVKQWRERQLEKLSVKLTKSCDYGSFATGRSTHCS